MPATVASLHRFPVKGLSPERTSTATLEAGRYFPGDRLYAVENGPSGFDETAPRHLPKIAFLMLMRNERLARLATRFEPSTHHLTITRGTEVCSGDLRNPEGRAAIESFLAVYCADELRGPPRLRTATPDFRFTDSKQGFVSLLNLASVRAIEAELGRPVDPLRFRANIAMEGLEPWVENEWVGQTLQVGPCQLTVTSTTERCAATEVDPSTGERNIPMVKTLIRRFGHNLCGVYARITTGGTLHEGDAITLP